MHRLLITRILKAGLASGPVRSAVLLCGWICLLACPGCSPNSGGRLPLNGNVKFKGQPLPAGTIQFANADQTQITGDRIRQGIYSIPAINGLKPGTYIVRIFAAIEPTIEVVQAPPGPEAERPWAKDLIPPKYNIESELTVQVVSGEPNSFDFVIP